MKTHKQKCNDKSEYNCSKCSERFKFESELKQHRSLVHMKVKCDQCEYYGLVKNIARHKKNVHKNITTNVTKSKKENKCGTCKNTFFDKSTLNRHTLKCKNKDNQYVNVDITPAEINKIPITEVPVNDNFVCYRTYWCKPLNSFIAQ